MKGPSFKQSRSSGFTLIEVLIALAVVTLALFTILGLILVALQSGSKVKDQADAYSIPSALDNFLTNVGFTTCYGYLQTDPGLYAYNLETNGIAPQVIISTNGAPNLTTDASKRIGGLFRIFLAPSPDALVRPTTNAPSVLQTNSAVLISSYNSGTYLDAFVPIQVTVYEVPNIGISPLTNAIPVVTYDTVLSR